MKTNGLLPLEIDHTIILKILLINGTLWRQNAYLNFRNLIFRVLNMITNKDPCRLKLSKYVELINICLSNVNRWKDHVIKFVLIVQLIYLETEAILHVKTKCPSGKTCQKYKLRPNNSMLSEVHKFQE